VVAAQHREMAARVGKLTALDVLRPRSEDTDLAPVLHLARHRARVAADAPVLVDDKRKLGHGTRDRFGCGTMFPVASRSDVVQIGNDSTANNHYGRRRPMLTIAHVGHWAVNVLYIAPVLIGLGLLGYQSMKSKRAGSRQRTDIPPSAAAAPADRRYLIPRASCATRRSPHPRDRGGSALKPRPRRRRSARRGGDRCRSTRRATEPTAACPGASRCRDRAPRDHPRRAPPQH
jgi:hypothetical protein